MLKNIRGLQDWCHKDRKTISRVLRQRIVKQNELDGDSEFTMTIGLGGKSASYWKSNKIQFWKWKGVCKDYWNPI